jgi:3-phenylpropionate/cinnamic acid dioxygenase small subunit
MPKPVGLERLIAQQEIRDLCYRYARGSDRVDVDIFTSTFWEDGGYSQLSNDAPISKIADEMIVGVMGKSFSCTQHLNGNILIDFVDDDHAKTEVYFRAFHFTKPELTPEEVLFLVGPRRFAELSHVDGNAYEIVVGGRYLDDVERRDGAWKIKARRLIFDFTTVRHSAALLAGEGMTAFGQAKMARDRSDPSYLE